VKRAGKVQYNKAISEYRKVKCLEEEKGIEGHGDCTGRAHGMI